MAEAQSLTECPALRVETGREVYRLRASGEWTVGRAQRHQRALDEAVAGAPAGTRVEFDLSETERFDTAGAFLVHRAASRLQQAGYEVGFRRLSDNQTILLEEVAGNVPPPPQEVKEPSFPVRMATDAGWTTIHSGRDLRDLVALLGQVMMITGGLIVRPWRMRLTSLVYHLEHTALRAVPIIALISFLIGGIIEQQGVYQLRGFGAEIYSVDLAGILILRELGVLLTAIMVAGRTGSAITAEIGSMKMREEIDALRTLALDPTEVLIMPRLVALVLAMPILTFVADIAALVGAGVVAWIYIDLPPETFISHLRGAIDFQTFMVGLIKAPFMAVAIGFIACLEGLAVQGSAESLGQQTTASVVKAIFTVIVLDGVFAIFFSAIGM